MQNESSLDNRRTAYLLFGNCNRAIPENISSKIEHLSRDAIISTDALGNPEVVELPTAEEFLVRLFNIVNRNCGWKR